MVKAHLGRMLRSMTWADRQMLAALRECPPAHAEALPLFGHVLAAEHVWLNRLEQREAGVAVWPQLSLMDCERLVAENAAGYSAALERWTDEELRAVIRYRTTRGDEFETPIIDILTHVVIHGAYHRGQIARLIGRSGGPQVNTDYILYVRDAEASRA